VEHAKDDFVYGNRDGPILCSQERRGEKACSVFHNPMDQISTCTFLEDAIQTYTIYPVFEPTCAELGKNCLYNYVTDLCPKTLCVHADTLDPLCIQEFGKPPHCRGTEGCPK
jgi:hypothetical protein